MGIAHVNTTHPWLYSGILLPGLRRPLTHKRRNVIENLNDTVYTHCTRYSPEAADTKKVRVRRHGAVNQPGREARYEKARSAA